MALQDTIIEDAPVFIGGVERSGKTYMRMMLAAHPGLALSKRTNLWTQYYGRFGNLDNSQNFERCLEMILGRKHVRALVNDIDQLRSDFVAGKQTYGRLFGLIHQQYAAQLGKRRWGDQSALLELHATRIFAAYPNAKMIQLIRDPRDRFEALCARRVKDRAKLGQATALWRLSETFARRNARAFPNNYLVVRYEAMVAQPEATMRTVCRFLDIAYLPEMILFASEPRFAHVPQAETPLSTAFIGRFQKNLHAEEIRFIEAFTRMRLVRYGYRVAEADPGSTLGVLATARFWGCHVGQMVKWRIIQAARVHLPWWGAIKTGLNELRTHAVGESIG